MKPRILFSWLAGTLMLAGQAFAQEYTFVSVDVRCPSTSDASACPAGLSPGQVAAQTGGRGINARGDIVGFYVATTGGRQRGFLLRKGQFTTVDFPVAGVRATFANGINARGEIVGQYTLPVHDLTNPPPEDSALYCPAATDPACIKGFYYWNGEFSTVLFPTTVDENGLAHMHPGAIPQRITADGEIYGCLHDHDLGPSMFGAVWTRFGAFSLAANGGQLPDPMPVSMSMNNGGTPGGGVVVGLFTNMSNQQRGYVVRSGMLEAYAPTAATNLSAIWDINPSQQFVGTYRESGELVGQRHAFLQNPDGSNSINLDFTCQDPAGCGGAPFGTVAFGTVAYGINAEGVVVGQYAIANGAPLHGFIAIPPGMN